VRSLEALVIPARAMDVAEHAFVLLDKRSILLERMDATSKLEKMTFGS